MGCHTWFYDLKEPQPTYLEVKELVIAGYKAERGYYERYLAKTPNSEWEAKRWLTDKSFNRSEYMIAFLSRLIRVVEKDLCKTATYKKYCWEFMSGLTFCERNNKVYAEVQGVHDIFRIGKYPHDELLSMKDTIAFIEKHEDKIFWGYSPEEYGKDKCLQMLNDFWHKYPNGLITFG